MTTLPLVRKDQLPEAVDYMSAVPDGCSVSASCFECPLPQCRHEYPEEYAAQVKARRNAQIWRWRTKVGLSVTEIARQLKLSTRSIHRVLADGPYESV